MYLIQHGFQKGSKIDAALVAGTTDGVIWSPGDETPANLDAAVRTTAATGKMQIVDPQLYVAPLSGANYKKLPQYPYFDRNLQAADFTPRRTIDIVARTLEFQAALPLTHLVAPTVVIDSVGDRWTQVAQNLGQAAIDEWRSNGDDRQLLISVACSRTLLGNEEEVNAVLDDLTTLGADGFYLLYEIDPELGPPRHDDLLERALWMTYSLSELNGYSVHVGYTGLSGYVQRVAGAASFAAGWWQKLVWWSPDHWIDTGGGGRAPRPRVALQSVLGSLLLEELESIRRADGGLYDQLVEGAGPLAAQLRQASPLNLQPSRDETAAQLFAVAHAVDQRVGGDFTARAVRAASDLATVLQIHAQVRARGIQLEPRSGSNQVVSWLAALRGVAARAGTQL